MATFTAQSNNYDGRYVQLTITQTQNIADNTSTLNWTLSSIGGKSTYYSTYATTVKINGEQVYYVGDTWWNTYNFPAKKGSVSGSIVVKHNTDGSLSVPIYFYTGVYASKYKADYGGTFTLDKIPRQATLTAAPNFNDEGNPTISYSNPAGNAVSSLQACISLTGAADDIVYRDISKTGSSYTFNLTDAERTTLRNNTGGNSRNVTFYVKTVIGSNTFYSTLTKTFSIVNGNPTLNPTVVDSNATTKALTGDANKLIKYYSNAYYTIGAAAIKGASLASQKVTHRGSSKTTATGTYNAVENATFAFEAKDSRGNTTTKTITKTLINYIKLSCNMKVRISVDGVASFTANGNYFNGSFGATANTLTVQYRYKVNGGTYTNWIAATASLSGNTYTATATTNGLNYQTDYIFQARVIDKLATVATAETRVRALPVFDWGENDFHVHGDLEVEGSIISGNNKILWSGASHMNASQIQELSEPISAQNNGIVLVFSGYDTTNSVALNSSINTFFISKKQIELLPDCGHTFILGINAGFSLIGAKYLTFRDSYISGHETNTANGTNSGITFNNSRYVLRYVIGV